MKVPGSRWTLAQTQEASKVIESERASAASRGYQVLTFNRHADAQTEFGEDATPFCIFGTLNVPDFRPFVVSREGRCGKVQLLARSRATAWGLWVGGEPRSRRDPGASRPQASGSCFAQVSGSPKRHWLPLLAATSNSSG